MRFKKSLIIGAILFVLLAGVPIGGWLYLKSRLNADFIVQQLETQLNARVQLKKVRVNIFSRVSSVELEGLALGPRDKFANQAKPLSQRAPLKFAPIRIKSVQLKLKLFSLMDGKLELIRFKLKEPSIRLRVFKKGGNNLASLFQPPRIVGGVANPDYKVRTWKRKPINVKDLSFAAELKEMGIEAGHFQVFIEKTNQKIVIAPINFIIKSIRVDPENLKKRNSIRLKFNADITLPGKTRTFGKFMLRTGGRIKPFDEKTGRLNPNIYYRIKLLKNSYVHGVGLIGKLTGEMTSLKRIGFKLAGSPREARLKRDIRLVIKLAGGRLTLMEEAFFPTKRFLIVLHKKSWIRPGNNKHNFRGKLIPTRSESAEALSRVEARLIKIVSRFSELEPKKIRSILLGDMYQDNRFHIAFASNGPIKKPKVKLTMKLPSLSGDIRRKAKELIKAGLKKKLERFKSKRKERVKSRRDRLKKIFKRKERKKDD